MVINNWTKNNHSNIFEWHSLEEIEKKKTPSSDPVVPYLPLIVPYLSPLPVGPTDAPNCTVSFAPLYHPPGDSYS